MTTEYKVRKRVAVLAEDQFKTDLINWSYFNRHALVQHELYSSGKTADILKGTLNTFVNSVFTGPFGTNNELANLIRSGKIDILILLFNGNEHENTSETLKDLQRVAETAGIIVASNHTTASFVLNSFLVNTNIDEKLDGQAEIKGRRA